MPPRETTYRNQTGVPSMRVPPQNIDSERALLGALMLRPESMHDIMDLVSVHSFYAEKHRHIFHAMQDLFGKGEPIDLLTVTSRLKDKKQIEQVGGAGYLAELTTATPGVGNLKYYAELIQKTHTLRSLISAAEHINDLGYSMDRDLDELLDTAEKRLYEVTNSSQSHKFNDIGGMLGEAWERLDQLHRSKDETRGIKTGFKELDNLLAGFQKSDLIILAARPSMGKTAFALDIARMTATIHKNPVGIFSLEMSSQQLVDRMLAAEARVDAWKLRTGKLSEATEFERLRDGLDRLSSAPIYIDDQPANNILAMRSVARRLKREHGLGLIVVDYLQLMMPTQSRNSDNVVQQVTEISRSLKTMARELEVPVLALSQLSRAVEQRRGRPRLSDLRDSGSIEQDADVVMFIHRDDKMNENSAKPNIAEIMIEKHRNGPVGKVELFFDDRRTTFLSLEKSDFGAFDAAAAAGDGMSVEDF